MVKYLNSIGPELQQGTIPPFIAEKDAVTAYTRLRGEPEGIHIYRDGDHRFSYAPRRGWQMRTVLTAASLEDAPPGFVSEQAHAVRGMYVYCPEDAGVPLPPPQKEADNAPKRKEAER